jgi:hypothetical protein
MTGGLGRAEVSAFAGRQSNALIERVAGWERGDSAVRRVARPSTGAPGRRRRGLASGRG